MNILRWAGAIALALIATPAASQSIIPQCRNAGGAYIPCTPVVLVDKTGTVIDGSNPSPIATRAETFQLVTANSSAAPVTLFGGNYVFTQSCSAYGTVSLRYRGPDGATMTTMLSKTAADSGGGTIVAFGAGAIVDVALSSTTGCNAALARIPS